MHSSVEELTQKIYQEGIQKAETEAGKIIEKAHKKAQKIVEKAEAKSKTLIKNAEKSAIELRNHNEAEMRLAARQSLSNLQQKIRDMLIWEVTSKPLKEAFEDKEFMQRLIEKLIDFWLSNYGEVEGLNILLPQKDFEETQAYLLERAQFLLKNKINITFPDTMTNGFQISPEDGRYKISFTAEDFENYFKSFAKPRVFKLLFGENQ